MKTIAYIEGKKSGFGEGSSYFENTASGRTKRGLDEGISCSHTKYTTRLPWSWPCTWSPRGHEHFIASFSQALRPFGVGPFDSIF